MLKKIHLRDQRVVWRNSCEHCSPIARSDGRVEESQRAVVHVENLRQSQTRYRKVPLVNLVGQNQTVQVPSDLRRCHLVIVVRIQEVPAWQTGGVPVAVQSDAELGIFAFRALSQSYLRQISCNLSNFIRHTSAERFVNFIFMSKDSHYLPESPATCFPTFAPLNLCRSFLKRPTRVSREVWLFLVAWPRLYQPAPDQEKLYPI